MTSTSSGPEALAPGPRRPHRVVVLCGTSSMHRHTCATLMRAGVKVVGIVECQREGLGATAAFLRKRAQRHGWTVTIGQVLGRIGDRLVNGRFDRAMQGSIVDQEADARTISEAGVPRHRTTSYGLPETRAWIEALDPDILVVHSKFIVGRKVRALARLTVLGGHPGITPWFRGAFSAFWALSRGRPDLVGWTVFLIDEGIDTGPIVTQGRMEITPGADSHTTLGWRGMKLEAQAQADIIVRLDRGEPVALRPISQVPDDSYFGPPTLAEFIRYRRIQKSVR